MKGCGEQQKLNITWGLGPFAFPYSGIPTWLDFSTFQYQEVALTITGICSRPKRKTSW